ncbi:heme exporter protein CcmD [Halopseudomonas xiamenensis]|uniref:heme exporter protein CcmD n=1 Tax=Halopseudomonas xiamenensis TaxID=157792 RepID=UPI0016289373|nr:heme exporter protein CcmD [Halopseudomonas xiamenensis]
MNSLSDMLGMGGHGIYVWSSYAITLFVLALNVVQPWLARRRLVNEEARRRRREVM